MVVRVDALRKGEGGELGAVRGSWKKGRSRGNYCRCEGLEDFVLKAGSTFLPFFHARTRLW